MILAVVRSALPAQTGVCDNGLPGLAVLASLADPLTEDFAGKNTPAAQAGAWRGSVGMRGRRIWTQESAIGFGCLAVRVPAPLR